MGKQEYERIRIEVHKKYKEKICELKEEIRRLTVACKELALQNEQLKKEVRRLENNQPTNLVGTMLRTLEEFSEHRM